jgi:hypothetical protein
LTWSIAILDDGITNATQVRARKVTASEFDYARNQIDTDEGVSDTHGNLVFLSALAVTRSLDVIDYKIGRPEDGGFSYALIEAGLQGVLEAEVGPIGAVSMSFGGFAYPFGFADEIDRLAARGVIAVAASGNGGSHAALEQPLYPAALGTVIAVGSHDGRGNPSDFSQNGPAVAILADGEDAPGSGGTGTSFAAPSVAATVANVQAIVHGLTGTKLDVARMVDVLQQGGAGPRSSPDPADGTTRYFLHDHAGSLDYAWQQHGGTPLRALEYIASHRDLIGAFGANAAAGRRHFEWHGSVEERPITFDALDYVASYSDLVVAFGRDAFAGATHFIQRGVAEGRSISFDGLAYLASYDDLGSAFGANRSAASIHYIGHGHTEGRAVTFDGLDYIASYRDLILAFGADADAGARHFITSGRAEGRQRDLFDADQYLANHADLQAAFAGDTEAAVRHFIVWGHLEGRSDDPPIPSPDFLV